MKVYFTASSKYKQEREKVYRRIIDYLNKQEHEVFEKVLSEHLPDISQISSHDARDWYKEWSSYIADCDLVLIEGSYPSTIQIGFELGLSLARGKPTILIFEAGKDPALIDEAYSSRLIKSEYSQDNLEKVIDWCLEEAEKMSKRRFTFFISPEIDAFLEKVADEGKSRSEYIRGLIEEKMKE